MSSKEQPFVGDLARQGLTVIGAVAQVALPTLLLPRVRRTIEPPDVVQPAPWTFAVWLPIYATSLAYAAHQARTAQRTDPVLREIGWPLGAAFAFNAAWAPLVVTRRYWAALVGIGAAAGVARRRFTIAEREGRTTPGHRRYVVTPTAGLTAWGTGPASPTATGYGATVLWALIGVAAGQRRRSRPAALAAVGVAIPLVAALVRVGLP